MGYAEDRQEYSTIEVDKRGILRLSSSTYCLIYKNISLIHSRTKTEQLLS